MLLFLVPIMEHNYAVSILEVPYNIPLEELVEHRVENYYQPPLNTAKYSAVAH